MESVVKTKFSIGDKVQFRVRRGIGDEQLSKGKVSRIIISFYEDGRTENRYQIRVDDNFGTEYGAILEDLLFFCGDSILRDFTTEQLQEEIERRKYEC